jgi:hypothetical protein
LVWEIQSLIAEIFIKVKTQINNYSIHDPFCWISHILTFSTNRNATLNDKTLSMNFGKYLIGQRFSEISNDLMEISKEEYVIFQRFFGDEKI